ncbi:MAG: 30S ribosomal protein S6--L-glutamate ligase [Planctomycetota bacterium]
MKLAILSREPKGYTVRRLVEAAEERGHSARVLDTLRFSMLLEDDGPELFYSGKRLSTYDAVIPRIGPSITYYGVTVMRQFEALDAFCLNQAQAIISARDKLLSLQLLSSFGVPIPETAFVRDRKDVIGAIERVGGAPVVIKLLEGSQGVGVILAETQKIAEAILETLQSAKQNVLVQKFVAESKGRDVRALVVGDRVVGAIRRVAQGTEFRSNIHRGGSAEVVDLEPAYRRTALKAARVLGLRVAGVDMLEGKDGPQVMEVNASPGLEGIETATGSDLAGEIVRFIEERQQIPDIDVRYRLGLAQGFGVAEVPVLETSSINNAALQDTDLRDADVVVLSITRDGDIISSPRGDTIVKAGDTLLCYGPLKTVRKLLPDRKRGRKKRAPNTRE